jgi:hypothetical protein
MKYITVLVSMLLFASPLLAETPCDFKGISVGDKMSQAQLMSALGVTSYKTNPPTSPFEQMMALAKKYSMMVAAEMEDWEIGPYCNDTSCRVPYGVSVGNNNGIPVKVDVSFDKDLIIEIVVKFGEMFWDQMLPIFDEKYGADWTTERSHSVVTNYETKKARVAEIISMQHITNGTNPRTKDHCKISAVNIDLVFEHHDPLGPYQSEFVIQLISKNF